MVVDARGRPLQVWTNLRSRPTPAQLSEVRVRVGGVRGRDLPVGPTLRARATTVAASASWGRPGLVWQLR
jgi:hypothetical protein